MLISQKISIFSVCFQQVKHSAFPHPMHRSEDLFRLRQQTEFFHLQQTPYASGFVSGSSTSAFTPAARPASP